MQVEDAAIKLPIVRPLIGWNKNDIINVAKDIGTYTTSIEPGGCCNLTPNKPETHAKIEEIINAEKRVK